MYSNLDDDYQVQIQTFYDPELINRRKQSYMSDYINIYRNTLGSPFNLFISMNDLFDKSQDIIHFFSYSLGKQRVVVWGAYSRHEDKIYFDSGCKYNSMIFNKYIKHWKKINFKFVSVSVENRIAKRINKYLGVDDKSLIKSKTDYTALKLFVTYVEGDISYEVFEKLFDSLNQNDLSYEYSEYDLLEDFYNMTHDNVYDALIHEDIEYFLDEIYDKIISDINKYETTLNLTNISSSISKNIYVTQLISKISQRFTDTISNSHYSSLEVMNILSECPTEDKCYGVDIEDETHPCAVFTYGITSFNEMYENLR